MHSAMDFLLRHGYIVIFVAVFVEQIGLPIPSGPVLLAAGALAGYHRLYLAPALAIAVAASLICDSLWFALGRRQGGSVLKFVCRVSIEPDTCVAKTHSVYLRYGPESLLISKFLPWFGTLGPPLAGMFNLAIWKFLLIDAGGALLWAGAYIACGWLFRRQLEDVVAALSRFGATIGYVLGAIIVAYLVFKFVRLLRYHRAYRTHRMTPGELKQRMDAGEPLVVVDLRTDIERKEGYIPGAIAVAYRDLDSLLPVIGAREVVFYCSCPGEVSSIRAALRLMRHGVTHLHALEGGFSGWRALGFPVDTPESSAVRV
jgi:membrane protein DedA with SNARE-associated domain/rhodanese-related sulfurtransferase